MNTTKSRDPHPCGCGCGQEIKSTAIYRPGHDAKHLARLWRSWLACQADERLPWYEFPSIYKSLIAQLPSELLKRKFRNRMRAGGAKYFFYLAQDMQQQWYSERLPGVLRELDPTSNATVEFASYVLANLGYTNSNINRRFS